MATAGRDQLFQLLNDTYYDVVVTLSTAFGKNSGIREPIVALDTELLVVQRLIAESESTPRIFQRIVENLKSVATEIHEKQIKLFDKSKHKFVSQNRVALFDMLHMYEIFPRMQPDERTAIWEALQGLTQLTLGIEGSSKNADAIADIANHFIKNNPQCTEENVTQTLFSQFLTSPDLLRSTLNVFEKTSVQELRSSFGTVLRGFGVGAKVPSEDDNGAHLSEVDDEDSETEEKDAPVTFHTTQPFGQEAKRVGEENEEEEETSFAEQDAETAFAGLTRQFEKSQERQKCQEVKEVEKPQELSKEGEEGEDNGDDDDFSGMTQRFAKIMQEEKKTVKEVAKRVKKSRRENPMAKILENLEQQELNPQMIEEINFVARKALNPAADAEGREIQSKMQQMFAMIGNGKNGASPEAMAAQMQAMVNEGCSFENRTSAQTTDDIEQVD